MSTAPTSGAPTEAAAEAAALRQALSASCADADRAARAVAELSRSDIRVAGFSLGQPSLDEVFLALTGHPAEEAGTDGPEGPLRERQPA